MVGKCKCGKCKFNLHNISLTEIKWMCDTCKEINRKTSLRAKDIETLSPTRPALKLNLKRKEYV